MLLDFLSRYLKEVEATVRHHKHIPDRVTDAVEPSILKVIDEARRYLTSN